MQTKLTLRMDDELIAHAKDFAKQNGKSVSQLVADYFTFLNISKPKKPEVSKKLKADIPPHILAMLNLFEKPAIPTTLEEEKSISELARIANYEHKTLMNEGNQQEEYAHE